MKVRVTCITDGIVGRRVSDASVLLEDALTPPLSVRDYAAGVEQFSVFFIAIDDPDRAQQYQKGHDRVGRYKHLVTGNSVKFLSVGVILDYEPARILSASELPRYLGSSLCARMGSVPAHVPGSFEWRLLSEDIRDALSFSPE